MERLDVKSKPLYKRSREWYERRGALLTGELLLVVLLTLVIHAVETLAYAVRLAGIRTGKLAVALSLTGIILLVSRTSNLLQGPLTGGLIDSAVLQPGTPLEWQFHLILAGAAAGTLLAILLFPTMVFISMRMVSRLEAAGSIPLLLRQSVSIDKLKRVKNNVRFPRWEMLKRLRVGGIPKRLLLLNTLVTGIYTVGVLSALYASYLVPEHSRAASQSSGLINGVATILLTVFIDPRVALLTDKTMAGQTSLNEMNRMFGFLMLSRFAGTLLAHLFLAPGAQLIAWYVS
ncbi:lipid II flippase Amj family protein [Paenibacillus sp. Pae108]|uniref:lipid II flippase Amj family protein n=1 Tax=Paenibacillus sp. Pae108 TaxID=2926019 RepID=UPI0035C766E0